MSQTDPPNLSIAGSSANRADMLSDFVQARLSPAAQTYWTAIFDSVAVPWNDAYSKSFGVLCELLAERDDLIDSISRTSEGETGLTIGQKGESRKHPLYTRLNQIEAQIHIEFKAFGMTPAGLGRIQRSGKDAGGKASLLNLIGGPA